MDEHELEQTVRAGLERRAAEADVSAPVVARARAEVSRRRRARWGFVGAAAASVVLVVGGIAVATSRSGDEAQESPTVSDPSPTDVSPSGVSEWRTEYWANVAVDVPADWGYGGAPVESGGDVVACFPEASVGPDGSRPSRTGEGGWVGRPIVLTDVCARYPWIEHSPQEKPTAPYVWLGGVVEPGVVDYANGYVQETVEVAGVAVTVASDDAGLREEILASARSEAICAPHRDRLPQGRRENSVEGTGSHRESAVCAYRRTEGGYVLSYATPIDEATVRATWAALDDAPPVADPPACQPAEFVMVSTIYNDPYSSQQNLWLHWDAVFRTDCGTVDAGPPFFETGNANIALTDRAVEPWSRNGVRAVLFSFIGPQG